MPRPDGVIFQPGRPGTASWKAVFSSDHSTFFELPEQELEIGVVAQQFPSGADQPVDLLVAQPKAGWD
jgi:hypothetical protein